MSHLEISLKTITIIAGVWLLALSVVVLFLWGAYTTSTKLLKKIKKL